MTFKIYENVLEWWHYSRNHIKKRRFRSKFKCFWIFICCVYSCLGLKNVFINNQYMLNLINNNINGKLVNLKIGKFKNW